MKLLVKIKLIEKVEKSGNYVYRFTRREMKKIFNSMFINDIKIHTEWYQYISFCHKKLYPYLDNKFGFFIFKFFLFLFNLFFGYWGNNFIMVVKK